QVVGPDGNPVKRAVLFCSGDLMRPQDPGIRVVGFPGGNPGTGHAIEVRDGKFEVPGCNPNKKHRVFILDISGEAAPERAGQFRLPATLPPLLANAKGRLGASVELSAKPGNEPITVRLTPCGSAEVGVVDDKGKPAKANLWLEMIVTPARGQGGPEWVTLGGPGEMYRPLASPPLSRRGPQSANWALSALRPGADGRLTIPALIPGATYRLRIFDARDLGVVRVEREFTVESGKTRKLPDIVLAP
ncbi:MAG TPA: hypothetical protein VEL76_26430, partial [Gemmataceae bacterium]|nr:hypothetical protein [Gemmataceae bacterium]